MARNMKDSRNPYIGLIPEEWAIVKLKRIQDMTHPYPIGDGDHGSIKPEHYQDSGIPYIRVQNLSWGHGLLLDDVVYISDEVNNTNRKSILRPRDILIAKTGATIGKTGIIPDEMVSANTTSSVGKVTVSSNNHYKYIFYVLGSEVCLPQMWDKARLKSAQPGFNIEDLVDFKIPLPSLAEQCRIASYLDKHCARIEAVIQKTWTSIEEYKRLRSGIIDAVVSAIGENECEYFKLSYIGNLKNGLNYRAETEVATMKMLGVGDFQNHMILDCPEMFSDLSIEAAVSADYLLKDGDIVFVRSNGSRELVGRSVMVKNVDYPLTFSGFCIRFRNTSLSIVLNEYLLYFFRGEKFKELLKLGSFGTNINNLSQDVLNSIRIPIPSIEEQKRIVAALNEKTQIIDKLISKKEEFLEELENYKKSLIYEYVTGKKEVPADVS